MLAKDPPTGNIFQTSRQGIILNVGQLMEKLRVDMSKIIRLLLEYFFRMKKRGPWKKGASWTAPPPRPSEELAEKTPPSEESPEEGIVCKEEAADSTPKQSL